MESYVYEPIDLANASFRLVRPYQDDTGPIRCELFHAQIHDAKDAIEYEALSYTWGGTIKSCNIELNGKNMPVTERLFHALQHLRYTHEDWIFWIDAICLDQQNISERGHQVQQMAPIYGFARQVVFWLGLATPNTDQIFASMQILE
ncbi:hypothetical protein ST47_g3442 [Ascochyta rabiei]|uniref:Uncharacterized protein n=1 Tax=Didymella rabiei TaxID=5454 RepID=A0A163HQI6_DIDRA|nr:hypothetical protein ST47_g3442 [Ascochyta rabiei]